MKKKNSLKDNFLAQLPDYIIENVKDKFKENLSFSLQFFDNSQDVGQDFDDWKHEQLCKLLDKLKQYSKNTTKYWLAMPVGKGSNHVLEIYKTFPAKSEFIHPKFVPLDVDWARFRLEGDMRLIGFFVNKETCEKMSINPNTFYIVFLDEFHKFYKK